jgi:hypothetical protein
MVARRLAIEEQLRRRSRAYEPVVIRVGADPSPGHLLAHEPAESAIVISDANAEAIFAPLQTPEMEGGMTGVPSPEMIILDGESLNFRRQRVEEFPESPGGGGFHF